MLSNASTTLVTGPTSGTGYVTARELARSGATVILLARNAEKAADSKAEIIAETGNTRIDVIHCDLADLEQVDAAAKQVLANYTKLDVLVNNAGGFGPEHTESAQGIGTVFAANYLGHFLLTTRLLPLLEAADEARVVNVGSQAHWAGHLDFADLDSSRSSTAGVEYPRAKLALTMFTYELAERLRGSTRIAVNVVHPGLVRSNFATMDNPVADAVGKAVYGPFGVSQEKGAETILYLATSPEVDGVTGRYFADGKPIRSSKESYDPLLRTQLWEESERYVEGALK